MEEITLTGGTLAPSTSSSNGGDAVSPSLAVEAGHSHQGRSCCHQDQKSGIEMMSIPNNQQNTLELAKKGTDEEIGRALSTLMRFGHFEALPPILEQLEENERSISDVILTQFDQGGHTLFHWAAKRVDDIRFLQLLVDLVTKHDMGSKVLDIASKDNVGMCPIHWACTEGSIPHTALLLKNGADPEAKDNSGCTPLLIAAQYGQVEVVAYLLKKNANLHSVDTSLDTPLHWAAYKGSIEVCGLLSYYRQLSFATQDAYGQTPLHLAALRGHTSVVRYILQRLDRTQKIERDVLFVKDKNERTPLDLAIHKNRPNVEVVLKEAMAAAEDPRGHFFRKTLWNNLKEVVSPRSWKLWMGLTSRGMDEMDAPTKFPFYFVVANLIMQFILMVGVMAPFFNAGQGLLWDKSGWLMLTFVLTFLLWYFFAKTIKTPPGYLNESLPDLGKWRKLYDETLDAYADENFNKDQQAPFQLCHTCHVARPHRSKHCRVSRKCVLLFDHYCPFVDNTVGLNNYKYFYMFLLTLLLADISFCVTLVMYTSRYKNAHGSIPWLVLCLGIEICIIMLPVAGLFFYHTQLSFVNLSTNEHMNVRKYKYLYPMINNKRQYKNPWDKGYFNNFIDRMNPSSACYEIREDHEALIASTPSYTPSSGCCNNGRCENV
eukprot:CAMPEP_0170918106 /NCGR_PEP_ID=MMETSP0735-20130129/7777_1 /TAXON_ID=186038 /ORGANISM="Fragilariopsis kerguelensis, Strain L26-C5" /LENGTH=657 /DNA_ID=CAMNT_0011316505 /DNA_START=65 /DNA_END=2038 /DNA_ORIENTATION=+